MGTIWMAFPFAGKVAEWVREREVALPAGIENGVAPTLAQLEAVLAILPTLEVGETSWNGPVASFELVSGTDAGQVWTTLRARSEPSGHVRLSFVKGWEQAVIEVTQALSALVGPIVLVADTDGEPILVAPTGVYRPP